jgi:hypothetical protein
LFYHQNHPIITTNQTTDAFVDKNSEMLLYNFPNFPKDQTFPEKIKRKKKNQTTKSPDLQILLKRKQS